jgi:endonuclease/exonuclease/phosphatase family metal-dependent hydrolase
VRWWGLAFVLCLLTVSAPRAAELKIATWNLNWLTSRQAGLPADVKIREPEDFDRLHDYAVELNADVVAIEEVDDAETARRLFSPETYSIHMSRDRVRQRVGIAVRRGLPYDVNPDVTAIALDPVAHLRSGVDITLNLTAGPLRVLAVHLKQGCQYLAFGRTPQTTCITLMSQFDVIVQWIIQRRDEHVPFLVLGDFNRGLDKNDPFSNDLRGPTRLERFNPDWNRGLANPFRSMILMSPIGPIGRRRCCGDGAKLTGRICGREFSPPPIPALRSVRSPKCCLSVYHMYPRLFRDARAPVKPPHDRNDAMFHRSLPPSMGRSPYRSPQLRMPHSRR